MKRLLNILITTPLAMLQFAIMLVAAGIGILWASSYVTGVQRIESTWSSADRTMTEEATWWVSNFGSIGHARKIQEAPLINPLPEGDMKWERFPSSTEAMAPYHPEGILAWHWFHLLDHQGKAVGGGTSTYTHWYLPYWMPFLALSLVVLILVPMVQWQPKSADKKPGKVRAKAESGS